MERKVENRIRDTENYLKQLQREENELLSIILSNTNRIEELIDSVPVYAKIRETLQTSNKYLVRLGYIQNEKKQCDKRLKKLGELKGDAI